MKIDRTIITPSLSHERFLGECTARVASQKSVVLEYLMMNGRSKDQRADVAAGLNLERIQE